MHDKTKLVNAIAALLSKEAFELTCITEHGLLRQASLRFADEEVQSCVFVIESYSLNPCLIIVDHSVNRFSLYWCWFVATCTELRGPRRFSDNVALGVVTAHDEAE